MVRREDTRSCGCGCGVDLATLNLRRHAKYASRTCRSRAWYLRGGRSPFGAGDFADVLRGDPCAYCSAPSVALDHIHPRILGGPNGPENLTGACKSCNSRKGGMSLLLFLLARVA